MKTDIAAKTSSNKVTTDLGSIILSPGEKFIRLPEVLEMTAMKKSTLYQAISNGTFVPPTKLGKRSVAWPLSWVLAWMQQKVEASRPAVKVVETSSVAVKAQAVGRASKAANCLTMAGQLGLKEAT